MIRNNNEFIVAWQLLRSAAAAGVDLTMSMPLPLPLTCR
jgi:hypothetical protein